MQYIKVQIFSFQIHNSQLTINSYSKHVQKKGKAISNKTNTMFLLFPLQLTTMHTHNKWIYNKLSALVGSLLKKLAAREGNMFLNLGGLSTYKPHKAITSLMGTT